MPLIIDYTYTQRHFFLQIHSFCVDLFKNKIVLQTKYKTDGYAAVLIIYVWLLIKIPILVF